MFRVALWILGEYAEEPASLKEALRAIIEAIGKLPLVEKRSEDGAKGWANIDFRGSFLANDIRYLVKSVKFEKISTRSLDSWYFY